MGLARESFSAQREVGISEAGLGPVAAETAEAMSPASDPTGFDGIFVSRVEVPSW